MRNLSILGASFAALAVPAIATAQPGTEPPSAGPATGVAIELRLESSDVAVDDDFTLPGTDGGFFIGYQLPRLSFGLGVDFGRLSQTSSFGGTEESQAVTTFLISPGVRVALARSGDGRTELLAAADLGLGQSRYSRSDTVGDEPEPVARLRVQAGPGVRYWVSPSFAFGATTGLRYDRMSRDVDNGIDPSSTTSLANTSIYTSLQVTGVF